MFHYSLKSGSPPGAATMTSQSLVYISFIGNGSNGVNYRYYSITFSNKICDSAKKGSGSGGTRPLII